MVEDQGREKKRHAQDGSMTITYTIAFARSSIDNGNTKLRGTTFCRVKTQRVIWGLERRPREQRTKIQEDD